VPLCFYGLLSCLSFNVFIYNFMNMLIHFGAKSIKRITSNWLKQSHCPSNFIFPRSYSMNQLFFSQNICPTTISILVVLLGCFTKFTPSNRKVSPLSSLKKAIISIMIIKRFTISWAFSIFSPILFNSPFASVGSCFIAFWHLFPLIFRF